MSRGQLVLCDLQGVVYRDGLVLTDLVILSRRQSFGVTDLSAQGISKFFSLHECNEQCRRSCLRPNDTTQHYRQCKGRQWLLEKRDILEGILPICRALTTGCSRYS